MHEKPTTAGSCGRGCGKRVRAVASVVASTTTEPHTVSATPTGSSIGFEVRREAGPVPLGGIHLSAYGPAGPSRKTSWVATDSEQGPGAEWNLKRGGFSELPARRHAVRFQDVNLNAIGHGPI